MSSLLVGGRRPKTLGITWVVVVVFDVDVVDVVVVVVVIVFDVDVVVVVVVVVVVGERVDRQRSFKLPFTFLSLSLTFSFSLSPSRRALSQREPYCASRTFSSTQISLSLPLSTSFTCASLERERERESEWESKSSLNTSLPQKRERKSIHLKALSHILSLYLTLSPLSLSCFLGKSCFRISIVSSNGSSSAKLTLANGRSQSRFGQKKWNIKIVIKISSIDSRSNFLTTPIKL